MKQAVLVIDVQESFRRRPYWDETELPAFRRAVQDLVDKAASAGVPALRIFHHEPEAPADDPFSPRSGLVRTLEDIRYEPVETFHKTVHSALYARSPAGTTLEHWLRAHGIEEVLVCGIRTEQCCETTSRHASDAGFQVRFVADATLTFPMVSAAGRRYSAADIRDRTTLVLDGRFARIVDAATALDD
ncbi:isochorismatase family protein [Achromobacter aloeverae]|uniref:Hydrolase n=1 Tax=Achromobacter aloeverae TaxID=1750518 RepID=A0A4V1MRJ5_9BURK|nr:isochorismatase family protein [Achromobacter aloeverae]RXN84534.1 hydrolase [Achromobacter aloeverae]